MTAATPSPRFDKRWRRQGGGVEGLTSGAIIVSVRDFASDTNGRCSRCSRDSAAVRLTQLDPRRTSAIDSCAVGRLITSLSAAAVTSGRKDYPCSPHRWCILAQIFINFLLVPCDLSLKPFPVAFFLFPWGVCDFKSRLNRHN